MSLQSLNGEKIAYTFAMLSEATGISQTMLRIEAKEGRLVVRQFGEKRHVITKQDAVAFINSLPRIETSPGAA